MVGVDSQRRRPEEGFLGHGCESTAKHGRRVTEEKSLRRTSQVGKHQAHSIECLVGRNRRYLGHMF